MKKFMGTFILSIVMMFIGGFVTYAATSNYYADLLYRQKEQIQNQLEEIYNERNKQVGKMVHNDMVMYVETKRNYVIEEMERYIDEKVYSDVNRRLNEHSKYVDEAADRLIEELKEYIDSLE